MREIKFRVWDKKLKEMCSVTDIQLWINCVHYSQKDSDIGKGNYPADVVLMQYTGCKDKNGVEIYEGDIVEYKDFSDGLYVFKEQPKTKGIIKISNLLSGIYLKGMGTFKGRKVEIIGNIHENPELLEGE